MEDRLATQLWPLPFSKKSTCRALGCIRPMEAPSREGEIHKKPGGVLGSCRLANSNNSTLSGSPLKYHPHIVLSSLPSYLESKVTSSRWKCLLEWELIL
ncbi:unnamed protein product [Prunus armeniaca]|uniref:Uncharacterized protein n=1 Tax=Prunus armeniaca TaxID=36596 RepID=A0A6J5XWF1_PRUAR|nr:unnamed protein product [Prunus armeniaca]